MKFNIFIFFILLTSEFILPQTSTIFIKFKPEISLHEVDEIVSTKNVFSRNSNAPLKNIPIIVTRLFPQIFQTEFELEKIVKINVAEENSLQIMNELKLNEKIEYVQFGNLYKIHSTPNDSLFAQQWALTKTRAVDAWDLTEGNDSILVCVIDTGIDYLHPDLSSSIYINPGETGIDASGNDKSSNGTDDDGNGFVDDYRGFDFTDRQGFPFDSTGGDYLYWDNNPMDENGFSHGTAVAGIIAATKNNLIGIAGVAPKVKILNLRAFDPAGYGEEDDVAAAILYAVNNNAKVINMSFGDNSFSLVLRDVIRYAYSRGVIMVASSGNSSSSNPHYPSGYQEVISVGNSTENDVVATSSNYGSTLDLVAPGTGIVTTIRNNRYGNFNGTSAAAPFVSAAAALVKSISNYSNEEVKQILKSTCDDINSTGWDLRTGAGRLNIFRALTVLAPAIVKFDYPSQDFATSDDTLNISATILSPYFKSYSLFYGVGLNPQSWTNLIEQNQTQFAQSEIFNLNISNFSDSSYTLRLLINQINGTTLEERINFHVVRSAPQVELISLFPALYGDKSSVMSAIYTNQRCVVKMNYRKSGTTNWEFVTLDGFTTNNQFVKTLHYGFIPKNITEFNTTYEIYFEAINLAGRSTILKDGSNFFSVNTGPNFSLKHFDKMDYSLPAGNIFDKPVSIKSNDLSEIALRKNDSPTITHFYRLQNNEFVVSDTLPEKIVKDFGDFNTNGKSDLLTFWSYNTYIYENENNVPIQKYKKEGGVNWPVGVKDFNGDGQNEIMMVTGENSISLSKINSDLSFTLTDSLKNFSNEGFGGNYFDFPNVVLFDSDNDGVREIWLIDTDGDLMSFKNQAGKFVNGKIYSIEFLSSMSYIAEGDFNGNGFKDLAILLHSFDEIDIASFHLLLVLEFRNGEPVEIFSKAFIDPAVEFNSAFQKIGNALKLVDINSDGSDELVLITFPYAYIFQNNITSNDVIFFEENINSSSLLVSDLNKNGTPEIALPGNLQINFYEFNDGNKTNAPYQLNGYSVDTTNVLLSWFGSAHKFFIYRGNDENNLSLIDSTTSNYHNDFSASLNQKYFYAVRGYNPTKPIPFSNFSKSAMIYHHKPSQLKTIEVINSNSLKITFDEKINPTIERINAFQLKDSASNVSIPNSVSPFSEYAYFISFGKNFSTGTYKLLLNGLRDLFGSPIQNDSITFLFNESIVAKQFYVESFSIINPYLIKIKFNLPAESAAVVDKNNYKFSPANFIREIQHDAVDKSLITLDLTDGRPVGSTGIIYTLKIENIKSDLASGQIRINDGAGSNVVLSAVSENLENIYFYPSPAIVKNNFVTFANLPSNVEISIWTIEGKKINSFSEKDNDGGIRWNLKDDEGNEVNTGVYLYRAVRLSDLNEELEIKVGKIAVIK